MSTLTAREESWRKAVQPCLDDPLRSFDEALGEAREYHQMHPVEDGILNGNASEKRKELLDQHNEATLRKLQDEHREALMQFFIKKNVPPADAGKIVDELILCEDLCTT